MARRMSAQSKREALRVVVQGRACRRCAVNARSADIIRGQCIEVLVKPVIAAMLYDVVQYPHRGVRPSFSQADAPE